MNYTSVYVSDLSRIQQAIPNLEGIYNKSVMITGATGLVCSAVVDFLLYLNDANHANIKVYLTARTIEKAKERFGDRIERKDVSFVEYDALSEVTWNYELDFIIHGASPANPLLYATQPVETMMTNIIGLNNVLSYARKRGSRVLFVSSSEVYGRMDKESPFVEEDYGYVDSLKPRACYPQAKRACETLCASYLNEYDVNSVVVRPGHIYGPTATRRDTRASSQFFFDAMDGHGIVMKSAGRQLRSYTYVLDCVSAMITVLLNGESGCAYNVSNPNSIATIRELAEQIVKCTGKALLFENPSDEELRGYNLMDNSSLDSSKLIELGWKGLFPLAEGVEHTIRILSGEEQPD